MFSSFVQDTQVSLQYCVKITIRDRKSERTAVKHLLTSKICCLNRQRAAGQLIIACTLTGSWVCSRYVEGAQEMLLSHCNEKEENLFHYVEETYLAGGRFACDTIHHCMQLVYIHIYWLTVYGNITALHHAVNVLLRMSVKDPWSLNFEILQFGGHKSPCLLLFSWHYGLSFIFICAKISTLLYELVSWFTTDLWFLRFPLDLTISIVGCKMPANSNVLYWEPFKNVKYIKLTKTNSNIVFPCGYGKVLATTAASILR